VTGPQGGRLNRGTLGDQVAELLLELILSEPIPPGSEIPSENELALRFGVNRLVIREAVRTLVAQELLVSSQGRPARVAVPSATVIGRIVQFRVQQQSLPFLDLLRTRELIESHLAGEAAGRVATGVVLGDEADRELANMRASLGDRETFIAADIAFHRAITKFADNQLLQLILDSIEGTLLSARRASWAGRQRASGDHEPTLRAHAAILDAVRNGRVADAQQAMRQHIAATVEDVQAVGGAT
jgi:GntR family transcriptional repressor for pyruvate dehydrogenase complex